MKVFLGWDPRDDEGAKVCRASILEHSPGAQVRFICQDEMRMLGLYWRQRDPLASTEFAFTRFLVPHLMGYEGWALFADADFFFTRDVRMLMTHADPAHAVAVVKHDFGDRVREDVKADGKAQVFYPRKWWSALVLWNCGHPANRLVTPEYINSATGKELHRFAWLTDDQIGELPAEWHWLDGYSEWPLDSIPAGIHYTRGGPWLKGWEHIAYADLWRGYRAQAMRLE